MKSLVKKVIKSVLPLPLQTALSRSMRGSAVPATGTVNFGDLRRGEPFSRCWGLERGKPVDRFYIEGFLARHAPDIQGRVLEIGDATYTQQFGGSRVTQSDVLHISPGAPGATIIGDLTSAEEIPSNSFDCLIISQTLQLIFNVPEAIATLHRILKPGGVALVTVPGITHICHSDGENWDWFWSFTTLSIRRLFEQKFPPDHLEISSRGNVLAATAFLQGLSAAELQERELELHDPDYEMTVTVRAVKATS